MVRVRIQASTVLLLLGLIRRGGISSTKMELVGLVSRSLRCTQTVFICWDEQLILKLKVIVIVLGIVWTRNGCYLIQNMRSFILHIQGIHHWDSVINLLAKQLLSTDLVSTSQYHLSLSLAMHWMLMIQVCTMKVLMKILLNSRCAEIWNTNTWYETLADIVKCIHSLYDMLVWSAVWILGYLALSYSWHRLWDDNRLLSVVIVTIVTVLLLAKSQHSKLLLMYLLLRRSTMHSGSISLWIIAVILLGIGLC